MKFDKFAGLAAAALAVSLLTTGVSAQGNSKYIEERTAGKDYFMTVNSSDDSIAAWCKDSGVDVTEVYGCRFYITVNDPSQGYGGAIGINATANNWEAHEWGNDGAGKAITSDGSTIEFMSDSPAFKADDEYANFFLQNWWGDFSVDDCDLLDKDGNVLEAVGAAAEEAPAEEAVEEVVEEEVVEEAAPAEEAVVEEAPAAEEAPVAEAAPAAVADTTAPKTGNASAAAVAVVMIAAAGAMALSKRK